MGAKILWLDTYSLAIIQSKLIQEFEVMKTILTTLCLLVASMTASYADAHGKEILTNGEVIASHFYTDVYGDMFYYTVKYDKTLFWCWYDYKNIRCRRMEK